MTDELTVMANEYLDAAWEMTRWLDLNLKAAPAEAVGGGVGSGQGLTTRRTTSPA